MRLRDTADILGRFERCLDEAELDRAIRSAMAPYGVESYLIGTMPNEGSSPEAQIAHLLIGSWPQDWAERYFSRGYLERDPTIDHVRSQIVPLSWKEADRATGGRNVVMNEAREFRLHEGITIPQYTLDHVKIGASFAGRCVATEDPRFVTVATVIASYATGAALRIAKQNATRSSVGLSPREGEVLRWLGAGKTNGEIGDILSIAEVTVQKHVAAARHKLGATTRASMIAEALRCGILN